MFARTVSPHVSMSVCLSVYLLVGKNIIFVSVASKKQRTH